MFCNKKVVVGISGGIAAYKVAQVVSWLATNGAEVHVIMTKNATEFIAPLTLQTLSGRPVAVEEFDQGWQAIHISLVKDAAAMIIMPATANTIAKIALGIADECLTSAVLAAVCPVQIYPAMNVHMYENAATQRNLALLQEHGYQIVEPGEGRLACGTEGKGRLPEPDVIQQQITKLLLPKQDFAGKKVLVTAGPTQEAIDPVRYLTNKSSGKMGYAIAAAAKARGAAVTLISGQVNLPVPQGVNWIGITSALEMREAVLAEYEATDIVIKSAAVADFRVAEPAEIKLKKTADVQELILKLVKNPDILQELGEKKKNQFLVGFAAETDHLLAYAAEKLKAKNLDLIVANDVSGQDAGFDVDTNIITILKADGGQLPYEKCSKFQAANNILDVVAAELAL